MNDPVQPCSRTLPHPAHKHLFNRIAYQCPGMPLTAHICPACGAETVYKTLSGGREWDCPICGADGYYGPGEAPRRAAMLTTPEGAETLRQEMREHLGAPTTSFTDAVEIATDEENCVRPMVHNWGCGCPSDTSAFQPTGEVYFCPTSGEIESVTHGSFLQCCDRPDMHTYLGYPTPGIEAVSLYLSDKNREKNASPPVHPGQKDPTTIKWVSGPEEAKDELKRLQKVARYYRGIAERSRLFSPLGEPFAGHMWAETIHTEDDGLLHLPVYAEDGSEAEGLVLDRENAGILYAMIRGYLGECPTECDDDCEETCHEHHAIPRKRHHPVDVHHSGKTALEHVTWAIARHDLVNMVGLEPNQDFPAPDHPFWALWRATARVAVTAYNGYIEHTGHRYLSTGCRHGEHGYCQSNTGSQGQKVPAQCKFCASKCVCSCHAPGTAAVVKHTADPDALEVPESLTTGGADDWCGAEPPGGIGAEWTAKDGTQGSWGDCDCTRPSGHEGDHECEPCTKRHGAPSWPQTSEETTL